MTTDTAHARRKAVAAFIDARANMPFAWGQNDCVLMVADLVALLTGVDHAADFRGRYADADEGLALVGGDIGAFVDDILPTIEVGAARDGDVGAIQQADGLAFGVFSGPYFYGMTAKGLGVMAKSVPDLAWRVA